MKRKRRLVFLAFISTTACSAVPEPEPGTREPEVSGRSSAATAPPALIGGQPPLADDLEWMERALVFPMYGHGDVDGDERIDHADVQLASKALSGNDVPCSRAADMNLDAVIDGHDVSAIARAKGTDLVWLYQSPHLDCRRFPRVASKEVGWPGETVPLLLLADLEATVKIASGPAEIVSLDGSSRRLGVKIDSSAQPYARVEVHVAPSTGAPTLGIVVRVLGGEP